MAVPPGRGLPAGGHPLSQGAKQRPGMIGLTVECSMAYRGKTAYLIVIYFKKNRENTRRKLVYRILS